MASTKLREGMQSARNGFPFVDLCEGPVGRGEWEVKNTRYKSLRPRVRLAGGSWWVGSVGDADQRQGTVVEQLVRQRTLGGPNVRLGIVTLEAVRVLNAVVVIEDASAGDVELVVDDRGAVMHPSLLQVLAFDKFVGLGVVGNHSPGVSCKVDLGQIKRGFKLKVPHHACFFLKQSSVSAACQ